MNKIDIDALWAAVVEVVQAPVLDENKSLRAGFEAAQADYRQALSDLVRVDTLRLGVERELADLRQEYAELRQQANSLDSRLVDCARQLRDKTERLRREETEHYRLRVAVTAVTTGKADASTLQAALDGAWGL